MEIKQEKKGNVLILNIIGRLDSNTASQMENELMPLIDKGDDNILVDFSNLDYISSAGLRTLLLAAKKMDKKDQKIILCSMKEFIHEVFEISGFTSIFTIAENEDEAMKEFE